MKKIFALIIALATLAVVNSCTEGYDDTYLTDRVDDLENRVGILEKMCTEMNSNIASLQALINASQSGDYITDITVVSENGVEVGYEITFAKNGKIAIYHGQDGKDGQDGAPGKDGADGKDGVDVGATPEIGVRKDVDGVYYWTLNGEWLLDEDGNKIKAVGVDGTNGTDGTNGKDGITPQLRINNEYWEVSYDGGVTWVSLDCKATGEDGVSSEDSIFKDVYKDGDYVVFELNDGDVYKIPMSAAAAAGLTIEFDVEQGVAIVPGSALKVGYTVKGAVGDVLVRCFSTEDWMHAAHIKPVDNTSGYVYIYMYDDWEDEYDDSLYDEDMGDLTEGEACRSTFAVLVSVSDAAGNSVLKSLNFVMGEMVSVLDAYMTAATAGTVQAKITTNVGGYNVVVPETAQSWLSYVPTKAATRTDALDFTVTANDGDKFRSAVVTLTNDMDQVLESFAIVQASANADEEMVFADVNVKTAATTAFDADRNGKLTYREVAAVTDLSKMKMPKNTVSFDELEYFVGIESIPESFFSGCTELLSVVLPDQLRTIGAKAFYNCNKLAALVLPESLDGFGEPYGDGSVFAECSSLTEMVIPEGVTVLPRFLFADCHNLQKVTLPSSLEILCSGVFENCRSLASVTLPEGLKEIDGGLFKGCSSIKTIVIPESADFNTSEAFEGCSALTSVTLPSGIKSLWNNMFKGCISLTAFQIPNSVEVLGSGIFHGSGLREIEIPYGFTTIPYACFADCQNLVNVVLPETIEIIESGAFIGSGLTGSKIAGTDLTAFAIPASVTSISWDAFDDCDNLMAVYMQSAEPAELNNSFPEDIIIYVPDAAYNAYKEAEYWSECSIVPYSAMNLNLSLTYSIDDAKYFKFSDGSRGIDYYMTFALQGEQEEVDKLKEVGFYMRDRYGDVVDRVAMSKDLDSLTTGLYWIGEQHHEVDEWEMIARNMDWKTGAYAITEGGAELYFAAQPIEFVYDKKPSFKFTEARFDSTIVDTVDPEKYISYYSYSYDLEGSYWINGVQFGVIGNLENRYDYVDLNEVRVYDGSWILSSYHDWYDQPSEHYLYVSMDMKNGNTVYSDNHLHVEGDANKLAVSIVDGLPAELMQTSLQCLSVMNVADGQGAIFPGKGGIWMPQQVEYKRLNAR